jgi:hypothetical protein
MYDFLIILSNYLIFMMIIAIFLGDIILIFYCEGALLPRIFALFIYDRLEYHPMINLEELFMCLTMESFIFD